MKRKSWIVLLVTVWTITTASSDNTNKNTQQTVTILDAVSCNDVIAGCDKALSDKQAQIDIRNVEMGQAESLLKSQKQVIEDQDRSLNAWYSSKTLWFVVGAGLGAYLVRR